MPVSDPDIIIKTNMPRNTSVFADDSYWSQCEGYVYVCVYEHIQEKKTIFFHSQLLVLLMTSGKVSMIFSKEISTWPLKTARHSVLGYHLQTTHMDLFWCIVVWYVNTVPLCHSHLWVDAYKGNIQMIWSTVVYIVPFGDAFKPICSQIE